ncbi:protein PIN-LIKES 3-like isoform X1 [Rosa rugosa]|uniref:protein PIN-LIKES 3-like isoform X1 n=1 Tax=Rosa rugosa TaxID=74645 RepID=UPI002B416E2D|nr:protein PIN-LIKES 3-like isoform X1 [Rosa rugosa]XP_062030020.1 protein PIN-LIKES 3-like isoform X1 [Rosa rugosa]XP_062030021.1 protein PIN-LIKES 3-like isoform X1 [Rosa rugosa]
MKMKLFQLFITASIPVLKTLLITALGSYLATERVNILGEDSRKHLNSVVFFVFNPALVGSSLAQTITYHSMIKLWFMPVNVLMTFIVGSIFGWILILLTRTPPRLRGLTVGCCAAGNLGNMLLIIIPAVCEEKGSPFGAPDVCYAYGLAYASLSMAISVVYLWSYVYSIVRISSKRDTLDQDTIQSLERSSIPNQQIMTPPGKIMNRIMKVVKKLNLETIFSPSIVAAIVGFVIGVIPPVRKVFIEDGAPLRVINDTASLLGGGAIPAVTLIIGGNLLKGLRGSGIQTSLVIGIIIVRYVALPLAGILIVKGAMKFGLVHSDPLYLFVLLLQFALPPAVSIATITQLFGAGEKECSVIMLWTYVLASVALTFWSAFFMWLVV